MEIPIPSVMSGYIPSSLLLWFIICICPFMLCLIENCLTQKKDDLKDFCLGITLSYALTAVISEYLKNLVGRPRPNFYFLCFPDGKGGDYNHCTGKRSSYLDGRKSFPSRHSSLAFACMTFLSMYFARKLHLFEEKRGQSWHLVVCVLPLMASAAIAISRTCDYHHHYEDVAAGSLLGSVISYLCFKLYFPKVDGTGNSD